ncbi:MAG TPA: dienelactone hydrolase family protein [Stellaceae bacterium]|nr:dienelactone hydrolase family protein [Stellaceae bacterium]
MSTILSGPRRPPLAEGPARQLVVLLHGVGADGEDLIDLAGALGPVLPHAAWVAPNAPWPCDMAPHGHQWFSVQTRTAASRAAGVDRAAPLLNAFLDAELARHGLDGSQLILIGFSQGTMMALHVGLRRPVAPAAIVGFSGVLVAPERLAAEATARPPILLVHGDADAVLSVDFLDAATGALKAEGFAVTAVRRPGLGHGIDQAGLAEAARFLATPAT